MEHTQFMHEAIRLAKESVTRGGGPFGAVIVRDGDVIATGCNRVTTSNDPTAHAEMEAIRAACSALGTSNLSGCVIYSSCEPCPMCLGAIYWARLDALWYGSSRQDASRAGFDDRIIYDEIALPAEKRRLETKQILATEASIAFEDWTAKVDKTPY
ncbi:MAG: nucleoside deaminase [Deltaproteobacteria bacterium]|nr:nucleoside deaminase [Deltaproteobacteria bacterium]